MKAVSPFLKHVAYPGLSRMGYFRRRQREGPAIVTYHGVYPNKYQPLDPALDGNLVTATLLRSQLRLLKARYTVISPEQFVSCCKSREPVPPRTVLLTCDDGLQNVLTLMVPLLQEEGLSCLFFVTGASLSDEPSMVWYEELYLMFLNSPHLCDLDLPEIDICMRIEGIEQKRLAWRDLVKQLSQFSLPMRTSFLQEIRAQMGLSGGWSSAYLKDAVLRSRFYMLTLPELRELANSGMSIGSHTLSHPMLSRQSAEGSWAEISESRIALQDSLHRQVWALAYPFGDRDSVGDRELKMAQRAGFACAFLNIESDVDTEESLFALPRIHVSARMGLSEFEAHVSGFHQLLRQHLWMGGRRPRSEPSLEQ